MADPVKHEESRGPKNHPVQWSAEEWARILKAAEIWGAREHLKLGATDVIRSATNRFVDEMIGPVEAEQASA